MRVTKFINLSKAAKLIPGRPNAATVWRWTKRPVRGVLLKSVRSGNKVLTTEPWVEEFTAACNQSEHERAELQLIADGVPHQPIIETPRQRLVDNLRSTVKPSSWSGINDYVETVRDSYRKNFWANLPEYVHIFCEKDAIAGTLAPVTLEYDVALSPIRGYSSLTFAHQIADEWNQIDKPITAYYLGDYDPSGFDLERDIREKLTRYCDVDFEWIRLGVQQADFDKFDLIRLDPKKSDKCYKTFVEQHGDFCAEIDAIPATELRRRIREAIESHVPKDEWERLQKVERTEKESFETFLAGMAGGDNE